MCAAHCAGRNDKADTHAALAAGRLVPMDSPDTIADGLKVVPGHHPRLMQLRRDSPQPCLPAALLAWTLPVHCLSPASASQQLLPQP